MSGLPAWIEGLRSSTLLWTAATVLVFEGADQLSRRSKRHPLCHPVLLATPVLIALLFASRTPYETYASGTQILSFLLGPATVALAVPLWRNRAIVRRAARPLVLALLAGSLTAISSAVAIVWVLGAPAPIVASIAPRAATTPVAMQISAQIGGIPALAAAIVLLSGVVGAMIVTPLMNAIGVRDYRARGFAAGVAAHGFGTVRAFQVSEVGGSFAGIGMALNAIATSAILSVAGMLLR